MKKSNFGFMFLALFIIGVLEYIIFSAEFGVVACFIGVPVLCTIFCASRNRSSLICFITFATAISVVGGALSGSFTDLSSTLAFVIKYLQLHLPAFVLFRCAKDTHFEFKTTIISCSAANLAVSIADLAIIKYLHKINMTETINIAYDEFSQTYMSIIKTTDIGITIDTDMIQKALELVQSAMLMFMPAILIIVCVVMSYITFIITKSLISNFTKTKVSATSKMRFFHIGNGLSLFTLLLLIITFMSDNSYITGGVYNFALLSAFAYMIDGFAVVDFLIAKQIKNPLVHKLMLIFIAVLAFLSTAISSPIGGFAILFFAGLLDSTRDFRKLRRLK